MAAIGVDAITDLARSLQADLTDQLESSIWFQIRSGKIGAQPDFSFRGWYGHRVEWDRNRLVLFPRLDRMQTRLRRTRQSWWDLKSRTRDAMLVLRGRAYIDGDDYD